MFVESLVESTPLLRGRSRTPAIVSLAVQAALVALLIAIPMLHPELLPSGPIKLSTLAPPPRPAPPTPPQPVRMVTTASPATSAPAAPAATAALLVSTTPAVEAPALAIGVNVGPANPGLPAVLAPAVPSVVPGPAVRPGPPLRISNGVIAGLLVQPIQPVYPQIARITRTEGTVVVEAIISRSGRIESAHVLSGPSLLQPAALEAVRAARYRPYLLNSEPTEVQTTINIIFHMSN